MVKKLPKLDLAKREEFLQQFLYEPVVIQWIDISGEGGGWLTQLQISAQEPCLVVTWGLVTKLEDGNLTVTSSLTDSGDYSDATCMPIQVIRHIARIQEV